MKRIETALITGASEGLGYELSQILAAKHYNLILVARNSEKLAAMKSSLETEHSIQVHIFAKDLSTENSASELIAELDKLSPDLTTLINNVGVGYYGNFAGISSQEDSQMIHLNVSSLVRLTKYALLAMTKNNYGKILNISSLMAFFPMPLFSVYAATKAFVLSFSEGLNAELKGTNISVTCFCPGPINTKFILHSEMGKSRAYNLLSQANPRAVAEKAVDAMLKKKRTTIYGGVNNLLAFSTRFSTRGLVLQITRFLGYPQKI